MGVGVGVGVTVGVGVIVGVGVGVAVVVGVGVGVSVGVVVGVGVSVGVGVGVKISEQSTPPKPEKQLQVPPLRQSPLPLQPFPGQQNVPPNPELHTQAKVISLQNPDSGKESQPGSPSGTVQPQSVFREHPGADSAGLLIASSIRIVLPTTPTAKSAHVRCTFDCLMHPYPLRPEPCSAEHRPPFPWLYATTYDRTVFDIIFHVTKEAAFVSWWLGGRGTLAV